MKSLLLLGLLGLMMVLEKVQGHMTIWSKSMYGVGKDFEYIVPGQPSDPIGPDLQTRDEWWFRGHEYRALPPPEGEVTELLAGGSITFEISCHVAWTSFGWSTTEPGSLLDACPGNSGAFHSGDPADDHIDEKLLSGCALAIADVDEIDKVTPDNLVIFSVQSQCVKQKYTSFEVPAAMPPCTGKKCICSWLANNGTANFYMTAFDCFVTNSSPSQIRSIKFPLVDPYICEEWPHNQTCVDQQQQYAKRPIYAYNEPQNVAWVSNDDRAGYHEKWGWADGAQNGIFGEKKIGITTTASKPVKTVVVEAAGKMMTTMEIAPMMTTTTTTAATTMTRRPTTTKRTVEATTTSTKVTTTRLQYRKTSVSHPTHKHMHVPSKKSKQKHIAISKPKPKKTQTKTKHRTKKKQQHRHVKAKPKKIRKTQGRRHARKESRNKQRKTSCL
ncbi:BQ2448_6887 [Microbotryum intermedium]|uniref:BQ2448_6887 protein n=1 Tax=Microbotryum intermedium TaxID=269621 RepID=A0A238FGM4_9BASI|nr:BQ2448_6887 [Microbotryum intermedium]